MTITNDIRAALDTHLAATTGLPTIAFEAVSYEQEPLVSHIKTQFIPTSRRPANRGPSPQNRHQGLYILTACIPEESGVGEALDIADKLMLRFDGSSDVLGVEVNVSIDYSEAITGFFNPPFYCIPVNVAWYAYS